MTKNTSAARFWSLSPLGPAASSPVGLESLGPSPPRPAAQGTDGEGTRPTRRARRVFPVTRIGVGMAVADHPSLRTGLADFPHPALQLVSHPLAAGLVRLAKAKAYREISPSFSKNALG